MPTRWRGPLLFFRTAANAQSLIIEKRENKSHYYGSLPFSYTDWNAFIIVWGIAFKTSRCFVLAV